MLRILALVVGLCLLGADLLAQDFSVTTRVFDLDGPEPNQPVARSRTLFHVGKVYDVIDGAAEATILEPAHRRVLILNSNRSVVCSVDADELKHMLQSAEERWGQQIHELEEQPNPPRQQIETLRFQLRPYFEWRGLGFISQSALRIRDSYAQWLVRARSRSPLPSDGSCDRRCQHLPCCHLSTALVRAR